LRPERYVLFAVGFFFFWLIAALSSLLTLYISPGQQDTQHDIGF